MTMMKRPSKEEPKYGLDYDEAMAEGMKIAHRVARRYNKWHRCRADHDDILGAALEAVKKAWIAWKGPEVSAWAYTVYLYTDIDAKRESNKRKSVVTTNVSRFNLRKVERDEGVFVTGEDGETSEERFTSSLPSADDQLEQRQKLRAVLAALNAAIPTCAPKREDLARDVILKRIATDSPESAASVAARHGVTSTYVYKIEAALREAVTG